MKIRGTQYVEVEINEYTQKSIAKSFLYKKFDWNENLYIKDGNVFESVEYATSHRWSVEEFKREATKDDIAVFEILKRI